MLRIFILSRFSSGMDLSMEAFTFGQPFNSSLFAEVLLLEGWQQSADMELKEAPPSIPRS